MSWNWYLQNQQEDKIRWKNYIKEDLRIISNLANCIQGQVKWKEVVEKAETFQQSCSVWWRRRNHSVRWLYACVPLFKKIFSDWLACRLAVFLTKEATFQNEDSNVGLYKEIVLKPAEQWTHILTALSYSVFKFFSW